MSRSAMLLLCTIDLLVVKTDEADNTVLYVDQLATLIFWLGTLLFVNNIIKTFSTTCLFSFELD